MISGNVVMHDQFYPHPPERVWRALVDPDEVSQWLTPSRATATVGHTFTTSWEPLGRIDGTVVDVEHPRRLTWRWAGSFGQTLVSLSLRPESGGTRLTLSHSGFTADQLAPKPIAQRSRIRQLTEDAMNP